MKTAKAYDVSIVYVLLDDVRRRTGAAPTGELAERMLTIAPPSEEDEKSILNLLDAIEARQKRKELAASVR